jgi:iron complex outermembrane receptor protein
MRILLSFPSNQSFGPITLAIFCVLLTAPGSLYAQTGHIEGNVVSDATGEPLVGVNVSISGNPQGTTTGSEGQFRLSDVSPGRYQLEVSFLGYSRAVRDVVVREDEVTRTTFRLEPRSLEFDQVVISATRRAEPLASVPTSVTSISPEELSVQQSITGDLGEIITQSTPGLGPSTGTLSNYGQTLRGRNLSVLIDGVPQSTPLRNVFRDLHTIDLTAIERVEVVRGASAAYGYGATGGMINIITNRPRKEGPQFTTRVGSRLAPAEPGESMTGQIFQQVAGRSENIGYTVAGSYQNRGVRVDGEGDIIPPDPHGQGGLAQSDEYNVLAKADLQLGRGQELTFSANYYDLKQNVSFKTIDGIAGDQKSSVVASDSIPGKDPGTENLVLHVEYSRSNVVGSRLSAIAYLQDYMSRFGYADYFPGGGGQSYLTSTKVGTRIDVETPLPAVRGSELHWGVDALADRTAQPLEDGRSYVPPIRQLSAAPFVQLKLPLRDRLLIRAGTRYEQIGLTVDDFTTLFGDHPVEGGQLTYNTLVFNVGGVVFLTDHTEFFAAFSQGFSVNDIGRALRSTSASSVEQFTPEAQKVNSYELGLRRGSSMANASLTGFLNTSELGSSFGDLPELAIIRSPERVYGVEASADVQPTKQLRVGGTFTWMEGKRDSNDDGSYGTYLPGDRISPAKVTTYLAYNPANRWHTRLQLLHSGDRDRFPGSEAFGEGPVESFTRVDWQGSMALGPGNLQFGIENLFDTFYFPPISQWYNYGYGYSAAPGRTVSVSYSVTW